MQSRVCHSATGLHMRSVTQCLLDVLLTLTSAQCSVIVYLLSSFFSVTAFHCHLFLFCVFVMTVYMMYVLGLVSIALSLLFAYVIPLPSQLLPYLYCLPTHYSQFSEDGTCMS